MKDEKIGWFAHPGFEKHTESFESVYTMIDVIANGDHAFPRISSRKYEGRHCLFCDQGYPEVKFKNDAHLLPYMIGNTTLFSSFECDECNNRFSLMETDLASFLGLSRSITGITDSKKAPGFPGIGTKAKSLIFKGKNIVVTKNETAERDVQAGTTKIKHQKPTYTPDNIYKLFLKCALSILPNDEVKKDYSAAIEYLTGGKFLDGAQMYLYRYSLKVKFPLHAYVFKKKDESYRAPAHVVSFYFDNFLAVIPVLLHSEDLRHLGKQMQAVYPPPYYIYAATVPEDVPSNQLYNLSSSLKFKAEPEEIIMQFKPEDLTNAAMYNPKTGEESTGMYDPVGSKYFIATEQGVTYTKEELRELAELIEKRFGD